MATLLESYGDCFRKPYLFAGVRRAKGMWFYRRQTLLLFGRTGVDSDRGRPVWPDHHYPRHRGCGAPSARFEQIQAGGCCHLCCSAGWLYPALSPPLITAGGRLGMDNGGGGMAALALSIWLLFARGTDN